MRWAVILLLAFCCCDDTEMCITVRVLSLKWIHKKWSIESGSIHLSIEKSNTIFSKNTQVRTHSQMLLELYAHLVYAVNSMVCNVIFFLSSVSNIYPATATEICTKFYHHSHNENLNGCAVCRFACHGPCSMVRAGVCAIWKLRNECKMHILCNKFIKSKKILFATPLNSNPLPRRERHGGEIKRSAKGNYYRIYVC